MPTVELQFKGDTKDLLAKVGQARNEIKSLSKAGAGGLQLGVGAAGKGGVLKGALKGAGGGLQGAAGMLGLGRVGALARGLANPYTIGAAAVGGIGTLGAKEYFEDARQNALLAQFTKTKIEAKSLQDYLDDLGANGVIATDKLIAGAQSLVQAFKGNTAPVKEWSKIFADIAASGRVSFEQLATSFSKVYNQGYVDNRGLTQLANSGIPIIRELAAVLGVSEKQVKQFAQSGSISLEQFTQALQNLHKNGFAGLNESMSSLGKNSLESLQENFKNFMGSLAESLHADILFKDLNAGLNKLSDKFRDTEAGAILSVKSIKEAQAELGSFRIFSSDDSDAFEIMAKGFERLKTGVGDLDAITQKITNAKTTSEVDATRSELAKQIEQAKAVAEYARRYQEVNPDGVYTGNVAGIQSYLKELQGLYDEIAKGTITIDGETVAIDELIRKKNEEAAATNKLSEAINANDKARKDYHKTLEAEAAKVDTSTAEKTRAALSDALAKHGVDSIEDYKRDIWRNEHRLQRGDLDAAGVERLTAMQKDYAEISKLNKLLSEQESKRADALAAQHQELEIIEAKARGEQDLAEQLQRQLEMSKEIEALKRQGLSDSQAQEIVTRRQQAKDAIVGSEAEAEAMKRAMKDGADMLKNTLSEQGKHGNGYGMLQGVDIKSLSNAGLERALGGVGTDISKGNDILQKIYDKIEVGGGAVFS